MLKDEFKNSGVARVAKDNKKLRDLYRSNYPMTKFIEMLNSSSGNPNVEEQGEFFIWKKAYDVEDKESLRKFMLEFGEYGIKDDENLQMCYKNVLEDISELVDEGWVRKVEIDDNARGNNKTTTRVFFPKDLANAEVEFSKEELPENCQLFLTKMWKNMGSITQIKWEETLLETPTLLDDQEREIFTMRQMKNQARKRASQSDHDSMFAGKKRRRTKQQKCQNTHLDFDFSQPL